jgi:hypothetical protein
MVDCVGFLHFAGGKNGGVSNLGGIGIPKSSKRRNLSEIAMSYQAISRLIAWLSQLLSAFSLVKSTGMLIKPPSTILNSENLIGQVPMGEI